MDVAQVVGGYRLFAGFGIVLLVSSLACGLAGHLGAVRLLYGMGRDNVLPRKDIWISGSRAWQSNLQRGHRRRAGLCRNPDDGMGESLSRFLNFGALLAFMAVNAGRAEPLWISAGSRSTKRTCCSTSFRPSLDSCFAW